MQSNDVYLCGYYGMRNSGDNALMFASAWGASQYLGAEKLSIKSHQPTHITSLGRFPGTQVTHQSYPGQNRFLQYREALGSQQIIFGGGSVLHCSRDINLMRHLMLLSGNGPHRAIGVGLGPFKNSRAEAACKKFLYECDFVGVRDAESLDIAQSLSPGARVSLTFDLAPMLLDMPGVTHSLGMVERRGIGVALCPKQALMGDTRGEIPRMKAVASVLTECYRRTGEPVYLIDMNGHKTLGDGQIHDQLRNYMSGDIPVYRVGYDSNPLRVLARLGCMKLVIGMRLHASILAFLAKTPVLSLNYHSKCEGWCEQANLPKNYRFDADDIDTETMTTSILSGLSNQFDQPGLQPSQALSAAQDNFMAVKYSMGATLC